MQLVYDLLQQSRPVSLAAARVASKEDGGVVGMLEKIIEDSKAMVADAEAAEKKAQEGYADFVEDCNGSLKVLFASMTDKKMKRGAAEAELIQKKEDQSAATNELVGLKKQADTLKEACDSLVKNFDTVGGMSSMHMQDRAYMEERQRMMYEQEDHQRMLYEQQMMGM